MTSPQYQYKKLVFFKVRSACTSCGGDLYYGYKNKYMAKCVQCSRETLITSTEYKARLEEMKI